MTEPTQAAIVTFTNNGNQTLYISATVGGDDHLIATLEPGQSTTQVTPGHVEWKFGNTDPAADTESTDGGLSAPEDDESRGGQRGV